MTCLAAITQVSIPEARRAGAVPLAIRNGMLFPIFDPLGLFCIVAEGVECLACHRMACFLHLSQSEDRLRLGLPAWQWCCLRCLPHRAPGTDS